MESGVLVMSWYPASFVCCGKPMMDLRIEFKIAPLMFQRGSFLGI